MTWKVALPMYNVSPRVQREYEAFLARLLTEADVRKEVELLPAPELPAFWQREDVLLTQTCGYPYMKSLHGALTLLATPCFDFPGCKDSDYSSAIVTRADSGIHSLADAQGLTAAANDAHSNSGMNVLRHAVSLLARGGQFFDEVKWTGSHAASLRLVRDGEADIAAIDCVTYGYLKEEQPESVRGTKILQYSAQTPGLPLVASRAASEELLTRLRNALLSPGPALQSHMLALHIKSFVHCPESDYERILRMEAVARAAGYPVLA
ncbi:PhnD/SsuA/transferrin family substrate-binding protein [Pseudoduganella sp. FT26W]|uniref:PhnD/SsuA/transferrin family substrate-binding protein n=1 Tax=Duganella aquatilis TaxID=2666082 RepID=A0A844D5Y5_9BURK|nr:PhnD/SsuA/transferrin family substrate-binding protein [Duganella aquatilis]MRW84052.1 PhnD/SsuA/transferrin family substrate-binding protein [Duganella aquatilis]